MPNEHLTALDRLVTIGITLAEDIRHARQANEITPIQAAEAFERVARATRRTILLAAKLAEPAPAAPETPANQVEATARREIIRAVEDAIHREPRAPTPESKQALEAEFDERLDAPELAEDIAARPVAAVIADILRDMDLGRLPFVDTTTWRRRTPAAIRRLHARAANRPDPAAPEPAPQPAPPPNPTRLHHQILATAAAKPPH